MIHSQLVKHKKVDIFIPVLIICILHIFLHYFIRAMFFIGMIQLKEANYCVINYIYDPKK